MSLTFGLCIITLSRITNFFRHVGDIQNKRLPTCSLREKEVIKALDNYILMGNQGCQRLHSTISFGERRKKWSVPLSTPAPLDQQCNT